MVGIHPKNEFRIPYVTSIDLIDDSPSKAKTSKKKKPAMASTSNPTTEETYPGKEQVPLNVEPLKIVFLEKHAALIAAGEDDTMPGEHKEDEVAMEEQVEEEKDDIEDKEESPPKDVPMKEKIPEPTPADIKQERKATSTMPPSKWQKVAPSDDGSSPAPPKNQRGRRRKQPPLCLNSSRSCPNSHPVIKLAHQWQAKQRGNP